MIYVLFSPILYIIIIIIMNLMLQPVFSAGHMWTRGTLAVRKVFPWRANPRPPKPRSKMTRIGFDFEPGFKLEAMDYKN